MATLDREVLDVALARFAHPETVQAEQHGEPLVGAVVVVCGLFDAVNGGPTESTAPRGRLQATYRTWGPAVRKPAS